MLIVDVHAHLDAKEYSEDLDKVLKQNRKEGVSAIVCNGLNPSSNRRILLMSKQHKLIMVALGYYPCEVDKVSEEKVDEEIAFIRENKQNVLAIGEVGLDKKYDNDFEKQKKYFKKFIDLAKELNVPIIVHSRKAEEEAIDIMEEMDSKKVVMHCFSGSKKLVERIIKNKWSFSIPANVVRSEHFQMIVDMSPLRQLLTETDSPYLPPDPSIERNEPRYIKESLKKIAKIKEMDVKELSNIIFNNYQTLFL